MVRHYFSSWSPSQPWAQPRNHPYTSVSYWTSWSPSSSAFSRLPPSRGARSSPCNNRAPHDTVSNSTDWVPSLSDTWGSWACWLSVTRRCSWGRMCGCSGMWWRGACGWGCRVGRKWSILIGGGWVAGGFSRWLFPHGVRCSFVSLNRLADVFICFCCGSLKVFIVWGFWGVLLSPYFVNMRVTGELMFIKKYIRINFGLNKLANLAKKFINQIWH